MRPATREELDMNTNNIQEFDLGDKVRTYHDEGTIMFYDYNDDMYLIRIPGFAGHNGRSSNAPIPEDVRDIIGTNNECWWFSKDQFTLIQPANKLPNAEANLSAMKTLLAWYITGENEPDSCPLCMVNGDSCSECPWTTMVDGETRNNPCERVWDGISELRSQRGYDLLKVRIPQLEEWIERYEEYIGSTQGLDKSIRLNVGDYVRVKTEEQCRELNWDGWRFENNSTMLKLAAGDICKVLRKVQYPDDGYGYILDTATDNTFPIQALEKVTFTDAKE